LPLTLRSSLAPPLLKHKGYDPSGHQYDNTPPEVSLMACCVVAVKMVYGMDGADRYRFTLMRKRGWTGLVTSMLRVPRDAADPACALPTRDDYLRLLGSMGKEDAKRPDLFNTDSSMWVTRSQSDEISTHLVGRRLDHMSEALLDEYLGFCEKALLGTEARNGACLCNCPTGYAANTKRLQMMCLIPTSLRVMGPKASSIWTEI
jgi:RNA polymerase I-specific transcription initiation factor RRN7